jgi:septal ring factor EnvC (AmiA/AmiB activator)
MLQHYDKARQRLLDIRAREERRLKLAREQGMSPDEIAELERQAAEAREKLESEKPEEVEKPSNKKVVPKKKTDSSTMMSFEDSDDDDDLF